MKVLVNRCFGGFGLSEEAYQWLIDNKGIPVVKYTEQKRGADGRYLPEPKNEGRVIFDRTLEEPDEMNQSMTRLAGRYWETWIDDSREARTDKDLIECFEALGEKFNGRCADVAIIEIPDDANWYVDEYDGRETIREGRTW